MEFELPYPPSLNHYWRRVGARTLLSRGGRAFREAVGAILAARGVQPLDGPLEIAIDVHPPDRRRRDLDNLQKALLDALQHGGAYHDDSQIDVLVIRRRDVLPEGMVRVILNPNLPATERAPCDPGDQARPRACLKCQTLFDSTHAGHRICPRCARINDRLAVTERELRAQRGRRRHNGELMDDQSGGATDGTLS
jgi:Holliday junction resolvase RusA-like endonuclease